MFGSRMKNLFFAFVLNFSVGLSLVAAVELVQDRLATGLEDPMEVAIAPDGTYFVTEREGRVLRINPETGALFEIGKIPVEHLKVTDRESTYAREDGLQGLAIDPEFLKNQRIYLYYSALEASLNRLSRFTLKDGAIDMGSEMKILEVPTDRENRVCHHGGSVEFGPDGLLYLSTGDNTNPFESDGYSPLDGREGRAERDAQKDGGKHE